MSAGAERVNVLAVMDRAIERNRERGAAIGSPSDRSLREARAAVAELIEADKEYDEANLALRSADFTDLAEDESEDDAYDRLCQKFNAADERRAVALARVGGAA